jgi:hypothetical protein
MDNQSVERFMNDLRNSFQGECVKIIEEALKSFGSTGDELLCRVANVLYGVSMQATKEYGFRAIVMAQDILMEELVEAATAIRDEPQRRRAVENVLARAEAGFDVPPLS